MTTLNYTVADAEFDTGASNDGSEVRSRFSDVSSFLNGGNLDSTNINLSATFPWTGRHAWTISDANNDNLALVVGAVLAAGKYGLHLSSSAAQVNSALQYIELTNASSSAPCLELVNAGTGSTAKFTSSQTGAALQATNTSTSNATGAAVLSQAGTGPIIAGTLRTMTDLVGTFLVKKQTAVYTVSNSSTETVNTDLTITVPANFLKAGTTFEGKAYGVMTTPGAGPATARLRYKVGGTSGTTVLDTGAITPTVSLTDSPVVIDFTLTCLTVGSSGTVEAQGLAFLNPSAAISATVGPVARGLSVASAGAGNSTTFTINTTISNDLVLTFTWGTAVAGCSFSFRAGYIKLLS